MQLRPKRHRARARQSGFTVTDVLVATSLSLLAVSAFAGFGRSQLSAMRNQAQQNDMQMTARSIVDLFTREVRRAGANPACSPGLTAIADARATLIHIQSDLDGDGTVTGPGEDVVYQYRSSPDGFERTANGAVDVLIDGIALQGSRIRYFDGSGAELVGGGSGLHSAERDAVRRVRIELSIAAASTDPSDTEPLRVQVANDVDLRNRYFANAVACP
jgi:hypothetical protein